MPEPWNVLRYLYLTCFNDAKLFVVEIFAKTKEREKRLPLAQTSENMERLPVQQVYICMLTVTVATVTVFGCRAIAVFAYEGKEGRTRHYTLALKQETPIFAYM